MEVLAIEKNIPLPKIRGSVYPFKKMDIADSFLIKLEKKENIYKQKQKIYLAIWRYCQVNTNKKFATASVKDGLRIWRIQ